MTLANLSNKPQVFAPQDPGFVPSIAPLPDWSVIEKCDHFVQFYEDDEYLIRSVSDFIGANLRAGQAAITITTPVHRAALDQALRADGLDPEKARRSGQYVALDAAETLALFMVEGRPDPRLFNEVVGQAVSRALHGGRSLRAFGEMVALLWAEGNGAAAIRLEQLWNELGKIHHFSLFCAYPINGFGQTADSAQFLHICREHSHVIPSESYVAASTGGEERLRAIAFLQQKAQSLEAEMQRRKETEKALLLRERELSDFLENAAECIHQVGPDGTILWANQAELDLLGYKKEEFLGRNIKEFHADPAAITSLLDRLKQGEKFHDYEVRLKHKDGSIRYGSVNTSVFWEGDQFVYTRCFTRDITARKRAAEILEETVAQRTAQLRESVAELEAVSYSISHDMRAPLRAMSGYTTTVLEQYGSSLDLQAVALLHRVQRGAQRLDSLIQDVLTYAKVSQDRLELKPVRLDSMIEEVLHQNPDFARARKCITLQKSFHCVLAHHACFAQCLDNLVGNAIKFVPPGLQPNIRIWSEPSDGHIKIWVSDNGVGIAPEHHDRIFEIFGRVYPEKQFHGSGIGLAIAKKAAHRMGGQIGFQSEPGKGSDFWFTLKLAPA